MSVAVETGVKKVVEVVACGEVGAAEDEVDVTSGTVVFAMADNSVLVVQVVVLSTTEVAWIVGAQVELGMPETMESVTGTGGGGGGANADDERAEADDGGAGADDGTTGPFVSAATGVASPGMVEVAVDVVVMVVDMVRVVEGSGAGADACKHWPRTSEQRLSGGQTPELVSSLSLSLDCAL